MPVTDAQAPAPCGAPRRGDGGTRPGIALIGAGMIASYHAAGLAAAGGVAPRVVTSRDPARAAAFARRHCIAEATADFEATLARPDIAAVIITTPDDTHEAIALRAAAHGKAMLLQKPMAISSAACRRIIDAAVAAGVDLQVSYMHRFFEEIDAARALLDQGAIGTVTSVRLRNATPGPDWGEWFLRRDRVPLGVVLQLGVHGIDLIEHLFGAILTVSARMATLRPARSLADGREVAVENADSAWCVYDLPGGVVASHEMSMIEAAGTDRFRMEIHGTEGTIWLRGEPGRLALRRRGADRWETPDLPTAPAGQRQHQAWIDSLSGVTPNPGTAQAGLRGLLVAEAIGRSSACGGAVQAVECLPESIGRRPITDVRALGT